MVKKSPKLLKASAVEAFSDFEEGRAEAAPDCGTMVAELMASVDENGDDVEVSEKKVNARISTKTVEAHRTSLMRKLGVRKATELVRYAVRHGLIEA